MMPDPEPNPAMSEMRLILRLEGEAFGLPVGPVHEIIDPPEITPVPNADPLAPGLMNVRGVVVPVIDVRHRLEMPPAEPGPSARMIVLEHEIDGVPCRLAFAADAVEDVFEPDLATLEPVPQIGARWPACCIAGALRHRGELVVLLDPAALFTPDAARATSAA